MNIFEFATRNKLRFPFRGICPVEDLWDLSREHLDQIYKTLNKERKQIDEEGLIGASSDPCDIILDIKLQIVKHIFEVKNNELAARQAQAEKAEKRQHILEILAKKQEDALQNKSEDDLLAMLKELDN